MRVRFTQPYVQSSLAILARYDTPTFWRRIAPIFSRTLFTGIGLLLGLLLLVGVLVWLAERKRNPDHFPPNPIRGVGNGMWFALVTFTTVGYGDRTPVSGAGRMIAGVWMLIALVGASSLTAGIASTLTVSSLSHGAIENAEQLANRRVAAVRGSPAARFARRHNARLVEVPNLPAATDALMQRRAEAVVFDRPQLLYYVHRHPDAGVNVSQSRYAPQGYGFALPLASGAFVHRLNVALLEIEENGQVRQIANEWIGRALDE